MSRLTNTFRKNGNPTSFVTHKPKEAPQQPRDKPITTVSLPYNRGLSENLRRIYGAYIRTVFRGTTTLRRSLTNVRPLTTKEQTKNCIYDIQCSCGRSYKGETGRPLAVRLEEHRRATTRGETLKSGVAEHAWSEGDHRPARKIPPSSTRRHTDQGSRTHGAAAGPLASNSLSKPSIDIIPIWLPLLRKSQKHPRDK